MNRSAWAVLLLCGCGSEVAEEQKPEPVEAVDGELRTAPVVEAWVEPGLCDDLKEVLLNPVNDPGGRIGIAQSIRCDRGYGVDHLEIWGPFAVGYVSAQALTPQIKINGQQVATMDLQFTGSAARKLFNGMSRTWSVYAPDDQRLSAMGRFSCVKSSSTKYACRVRNVVGMFSPDVQF